MNELDNLQGKVTALETKVNRLELATLVTLILMFLLFIFALIK